MCGKFTVWLQKYLSVSFWWKIWHICSLLQFWYNDTFISISKNKTTTTKIRLGLSAVVSSFNININKHFVERKCTIFFSKNANQFYRKWYNMHIAYISQIYIHIHIHIPYPLRKRNIPKGMICLCLREQTNRKYLMPSCSFAIVFLLPFSRFISLGTDSTVYLV